MHYRIILIVLFILSVLASGPAVAAPYRGESFTFTQPDGTPFDVRLYGDNYFATIETTDGYTLTKDPSTGFYYYAEPAADGMSFQTTGYKAEEKLPPNHLLIRKNRLLPEAIVQKSTSARRKFGVDTRGQLLQPLRLRMRPQDFGYPRYTDAIEAQALSMEKSPDGPFKAPPSNATTGNRVGLVLLAQFPDQPNDVTITQAQVDAYANDPDYTDFNNATSVYGYFNIQSEGKLQYNCAVTAYFTAANPRSYYTSTSVAFGTRAKELINEGLAVLKDKGFDFTSTDANNDNVLDGVNLFYAGSRVNNWSQGLWPHKWSSSWAGLSGEISTSFQYQITDMGSSLSLGTFCHENGHMICGFPDLYAYDSNAAEVTNFSLMSQSGSTHPVSVDPYLKMHAGWATIIDITSADHLRGALQVDKNTFYRYKNPARATEYFLLSMRTNSGYEGIYGGSASSVNPANGLVIWHAYENGSNTYSSIITANSPSASYTTPYELMVVESNPSSSTTPWYDDPSPGSNDAWHAAGISAASDTTTPALKFWNTSNGRTTASGMNVHTIGAQGDTISFTVGAGAVVNAAEIGLTATALSPTCDFGTNASAQTFSIFNSGGGTLNYTFSESLDWLSLSSTSGSATTEANLITISYATSGLEAGTYNGTITITDGAASNTPQTLSVSLTVNAPPAIAANPNELEASLRAGTTTTKAFTISNTGSGTLEYALSESESWLSLDRASGTAKAESDEILVTLDASDLFEGTYSTDITITDSNGTSTPETVTVTLNITGNIIVHNPSGGNTLWQDNRHTITWQTDENVTDNVDIVLYKNGIQDSIIASDQANNGLYQWGIPADQATGADYRIRVINTDSSSIYGESLSDFTISAMPSLTSIPYNEGFESDTGSWVQSGDDDFNWTRDSAGTPSSSTGPGSAQSGSFYIYTEASTPNNPAKSAVLENTFDLRAASSPVLSFAYHMYGSSMGTLTVSASVDQTDWTTLFTKTGDQGNSWQTVNTDLSQFAGQAVAIRINGTTGSSYFSDMALDAVSISETAKTLTLSSEIFSESGSGNGAISNSITFTLAGDTYTSDVVTDGYATAANVPGGLTAAFVRNSDTQITLLLTGNATDHDNKDSIFDLQIQFADGAFNSGDSSNVANGTKNLIVDFFDTIHLLTVTRTGIGSGAITSSPSGINCGSDCSDNYLENSVITLTATPSDSYSWFSEWSGGCSGTGNCVVTLSEATSVTARFDAEDSDNDNTPDHLDAFPNNPAYFDDGDNDGLPTAWETLYSLNTSLNDAGLDPDGDSLTNLHEFTMGTNPKTATAGPGIAVLTSPDNTTAQQSLTPVLETDYADSADTDMHLQTLWEISKNSNFTTIVFRTTSSTFKTQLTVPRGILDAGETVYWRARYIDTESITWPWSTSRSYTTAAALSPDLNNNGLPDSKELPSDSTVDLDQNDIPDLSQSEMHCISLPDDTGQVCLKDGNNILTTNTFSWMLTDTLETVSGLQDWLLSFRLLTETVGATVSLTVFFSEPLPINTTWYKYDAINGWQDFSANATISTDRKSLTLTITDGGTGDADGIANGIIVDPSGPVVGSALVSGSSDSQGGCFIKAVMNKKGVK